MRIKHIVERAKKIQELIAFGEKRNSDNSQLRSPWGLLTDSPKVMDVPYRADKSTKDLAS